VLQWVGEMEEIATFVSSATGSDASTLPSQDLASIYRGMAATFERVAKDIAKGEKGGEDVKTLSDWSKQGKKRLADDAEKASSEEESKKRKTE
jgi:hypothetical protein